MAPPLASAALLASSAAGATPTSRPPPPPRTVAAARAHSASISEGNSRQSPGAGSSATSGGKARSGSKTSVKREAPSTTEEDAELAAQKEANRKRPKPMLSCIECKVSRTPARDSRHVLRFDTEGAELTASSPAQRRGGRSSATGRWVCASKTA